MKSRLLILALAIVMSGGANALYDPKPIDDVADAQGEWRGKLTYDDYSQPGRLVTLPARLFVAMGSPTELVLQYVFDDGPGKTVYSYERMNFDLGKGEVTWSSGASAKAGTTSIISSNAVESGIRRIVFERKSEKGLERHTLEVGQKLLSLKKEEIDGAGAARFRNKYEFQRAGS